MADRQMCRYAEGGPGLFAQLSGCRPGSVALRAEQSVHRWSSSPRRLEPHHLQGQAVLGDKPQPVDVQLDLSRWPQLVLKALGSEYDKEAQRVQDASAAEIKIPARDILGRERLSPEGRAALGHRG